MNLLSFLKFIFTKSSLIFASVSSLKTIQISLISCCKQINDRDMIHWVNNHWWVKRTEENVTYTKWYFSSFMRERKTWNMRLRCLQRCAYEKRKEHFHVMINDKQKSKKERKNLREIPSLEEWREGKYVLIMFSYWYLCLFWKITP